MPMVQWVVLKMLPFDNKSEFQLVLDMPEGATLEQTERTLLAVGRELAKVPDVKDYQIYADTAAPINFNGLVRHYFIRSGANVGIFRSIWWTSMSAIAAVTRSHNRCGHRYRPSPVRWVAT